MSGMGPSRTEKKRKPRDTETLITTHRKTSHVGNVMIVTTFTESTSAWGLANGLFANTDLEPLISFPWPLILFRRTGRSHAFLCINYWVNGLVLLVGNFAIFRSQAKFANPSGFMRECTFHIATLCTQNNGEDIASKNWHHQQIIRLANNMIF